MTETQDVPDALYNRYRPRRLSELVGQDHVAVPLRRAFEKGRIHHAYLLSGPRGCGKTSTARILAAGLVCENGPTADPCNTCDQCRSVINGNHLDVIELDAATNGRVDDARELREKAHFSPAMARYKVIVIDEAHMVTKEGFNALLKLIEEPPPHVRFIFATTDPDKVLPTIRSRTYHYSFRLVPAPALAAHLESVVAQEGYTVDAGVYPLVLRAGGGSMRDSLAVLGQLLDGADGTTVRLDEAAALLGATADTVLDDALEALASRDTARLLGVIGAAIDTGMDPRRLGEDLLDRLRDLLLLATTGVLPPLAEVAGAQRQAAWQSVTQRLGVRGLTIACEVLQGAVGHMHSGQPRITLEVASARILLNLADSVDVNAALRSLADQVARLSTGGPALPEVYAAAPPAPQAEVPAVVTPPVVTPPVVAPPVVTPPPSTPVTPTAPALEPLAVPEPVAAPKPEPVSPEPEPVSPLTAIGTIIEETSTGHAAPDVTPTPTPSPPQTVAETAPHTPAPEPVTPAPFTAPVTPTAPPSPTRAPASNGDGLTAWPHLLQAVGDKRRATWMLLNAVQPASIADGRIVVTANPGFEQGFRNSTHEKIVNEAATEVLGGTWIVEVQPA